MPTFCGFKPHPKYLQSCLPLVFQRVPRYKFVIAAAFFCVFCSLCVSCAGGNQAESGFKRGQYKPFSARSEAANWALLDYDGKSGGRALPAWMRAWNSGGEAAIEKLSAYSDYYCFIIEQSGINLDILQRWSASLDIERGIARAITRRTFKRWTANLDKSPDIVYGHYFERLILALASKRWDGARRESARWIYVQYDDSNPDSVVPGAAAQNYGAVYRMIVFAVIDKDEFYAAMEEVFNSIPMENDKKINMRGSDPAALSRVERRAQNAACEQLISQFWKGF